MNHRVTCVDCGRFWRESCRDCADDVGRRHRVLTGHRVEFLFVVPDVDDDAPAWFAGVARAGRSVLVRRWGT